MERLIGAGGWAHFRVPGADALTAYASAFPFVEVNATFYENPDLRSVDAWRSKVPTSFRFSVRVHRDVTHRQDLWASAAARASFASAAKIAARLGAVAIVLQTPASVRLGPDRLDDFRDLLASTALPCPVGLEARAYAGSELPSPIASLLEDEDVADIVDFSRQAPRTSSSLVYGRMFGLGEGNRWEFTDDELVAAKKRAERGSATRVVYAFHGVRMYKDAARFLTFVRTGAFPRATRQTGSEAVREVLTEAAAFPASRGQLIESHGWRVIDVTGDRRVHARELLERLPAGPFDSAGAVLEALERAPRFEG